MEFEKAALLRDQIVELRRQQADDEPLALVVPARARGRRRARPTTVATSTAARDRERPRHLRPPAARAIAIPLSPLGEP